MPCDALTIMLSDYPGEVYRLCPRTAEVWRGRTWFHESVCRACTGREPLPQEVQERLASCAARALQSPPLRVQRGALAEPRALVAEIMRRTNQQRAADAIVLAVRAGGLNQAEAETIARGLLPERVQGGAA